MLKDIVFNGRQYTLALQRKTNIEKKSPRRFFYVYSMLEFLPIKYSFRESFISNSEYKLNMMNSNRNNLITKNKWNISQYRI